MKLYIMRHSQTDWNLNRRLQGQANIPLNDYGREIANQTAFALKDVVFTKAIASPLDRAMETSQIILSYHKDTPVETDPRLVEINFGEYEGLDLVDFDKTKDKYPELDNLFDHPERYRPSGDAESIYDLCSRTKPFLNELINTYQDSNETILIVAHGATIRSFMINLFDVPIANFWKSCEARNCETVIVTGDSSGIELVDRGSVYY